MAPAYLYRTSQAFPTGIRVRFDSDNAGTPAAVYHPDGTSIDTALGTFVTDPGSGQVPAVAADVATLYVRQVDYRGNLVGGVLATLTGSAINSGGGGGGAGTDQTARDAAAAAQSTAAAALPALDLLATVTGATPLTANKIRPFNATGGAITNTALPALSGLAVGSTRYGIAKSDSSGNTVTQPFAGGDTTAEGGTSVVLTHAGTVELQVVSNPAGGKFWRVVNHARSDATLDAVIAGQLGNYVPRWQANTAYTSGALVLNPSGLVVSANTTFSSGSSYDASNWTIVTDSRYVQTANAAPLAQAGQTPSQLPVAPGTAAPGSLAVTARADHIHPSAGLFTNFADGIDGDLVFDGTTNVSITSIASYAGGAITPSGGVYTLSRDLFCRNLTVNAGATINTRGFRIFVKGTATINGTIACNGLNATGAAGAANMTGAYNGSIPGAIAGASGGTGNGAAPTSSNFMGGTVFANGGNGGAGASGTAGNGGGIGITFTSQGGLISGVRTPMGAFWGASVTGGSLSNAFGRAYPGGGGGAAGGGDGTNSGGGGGGGAGGVILNAKYLTGSGAITANGGAGGTPPTGNCGGGGGGGGGYVFVNVIDAAGTFSTLPAWAGTMTANGGAAGAAVGTGAAGAAGAAGYVQFITWG